MKEFNSNLTVPAAIVIAGALIAGSLWISGNQAPENPNDSEPQENVDPENISFSPVTERDHILGDSNAEITLIEYSDFECPFCGRFHPTLERVVAENSDVRWVYRHFPLTQIHSEAMGSAIASECVAEIAGNDAFWQFAGAMFENQSTLGQSLYENTARELGVDPSELRTCMEREDIAQIVSDHFTEVRGTGATGTPHTLVVVNGEVKGSLPGALPFEAVVGVLDQVRSEI